jgi:hypothetical protein
VDILFLPNNNSFKYILVIIDISIRIIDIKPLKEKLAPAIIKN